LTATVSTGTLSISPASKRLRGVFVTHQHDDHYSGLAYLRANNYAINYLVYSPYQRRYGDESVTKEEWDEFNSHKEYFEKHGTKLYPVYRQISFKEPWWNTSGIRFWMLGPDRRIAQRDTRELHDACLVFKAHMGTRKCLFTGDASDTNLVYVAASTTHICDDILHASHHGSINGADLSFIKKCNADYTVIPTEAGIYDNVPHPTALRRYKEHTKEKVYRTDDGTVTWTF